MNRRAPLVALLVLLACAAVVAGPRFSGATFTSTSANPSTVRAADDWTPPAVTVGNPGTSVQGTVALSATASDSGTGVATVELQHQAVNGGDWVTVCTDATRPYSCDWSTRTVADGPYDVRARATDLAGYTTVSDPVRTIVANSVNVVLTSPGEVVRGSVPLNATIYGGASLSWSLSFEYAVAGSGNWKSACSSGGLLGASFSCTWATGASGDYDLRAVATSTLGSTYTSNVVPDVQVDNTAPTAVMTDPGSPLRGAITFAASATDLHSGVAKLEIQFARATSTTYQSLCTIAAEPFSCRVNTATLADGTYSFRAVATDVAGNTSTSAPIGNRLVDNTISSVSVEDPGSFLTGTMTVSATANSTAGVTSVVIQRAPAGAGSWTNLCSDTGAPYACTWNTTSVADGLYDLRAVLTDGQGRTTTSTVVAGRRVDNSPLRGIDVQTANGSGTPGRADTGDTVTFTYSALVAPASIGSTGASTNVVVRLRDGNVAGLGTGNKGDTVDVLVGGAPVGLGSVNLKEDYLKSGRTVTFNATLTTATVSTSGVDRTVVTVRLGTRDAGNANSLRTVTLTSPMVWSPSAVAKGTDGRTCSAAPVTETGAADREF